MITVRRDAERRLVIVNQNIRLRVQLELTGKAEVI
jgi:hypothetical protein